MNNTIDIKASVKGYLEKNGFGALVPRAALFDMDGVLYDSMPNHARSWHLSMEAFGLSMSPDDAYKYEGMRGVETIKLIAKEQWKRDVGDDEAERMYAEKTRLFAVQPQARVMPGVKDLQRDMKAMGITIVVVTGSGQPSLLDKLKSDFRGLVAPGMIVSAADVTRGKPDPEPYIKGLAKAGVNPWEAVVVENAPLGVRSAVNARIFTIAVNTGPLDNALLEEEGADIVLKTMEDVRTRVLPVLTART